MSNHLMKREKSKTQQTGTKQIREGSGLDAANGKKVLKCQKKSNSKKKLVSGCLFNDKIQQKGFYDQTQFTHHYLLRNSPSLKTNQKKENLQKKQSIYNPFDTSYPNEKQKSFQSKAEPQSQKRQLRQILKVRKQESRCLGTFYNPGSQLPQIQESKLTARTIKGNKVSKYKDSKPKKTIVSEYFKIIQSNKLPSEVQRLRSKRILEEIENEQQKSQQQSVSLSSKISEWFSTTKRPHKKHQIATSVITPHYHEKEGENYRMSEKFNKDDLYRRLIRYQKEKELVSMVRSHKTSFWQKQTTKHRQSKISVENQLKLKSTFHAQSKSQLPKIEVTYEKFSKKDTEAA